MIFVSVGTQETPFDRLLRTVFDLSLDEELVVQHGPSLVRSANAVQVDFLAFDEVVAYIRRARSVVTHAGVGSVMLALANGKRPIVMARRRRYGESVDDHQIELARRMDAHGLATSVDDAAALSVALASGVEGADQAGDVPWLGRDLGDYLARELGAPGALSPLPRPTYPRPAD
jgi:UDP-N-acetylglucosamine transferase subunit ALG13